MKKLILILTVFSLSCKTAEVKRLNVKSLPEFLTYSENWKPLVSVHRGGGEEAGVPENALESFQHYAKQFPCVIECDLRLTKDSVIVLLHDYELDRTTNGTGKLFDYTYKEVSGFLLEDNAGQITTYTIPTLEKALNWGKGKVIYTLDVKRETPFEKVVEMIKKTKSQNSVVVITYSVEDAVMVYQLNPDLMISVTARSEKEYQRLADAGVPDNRMVAFIGTREPKSEFNKFLHEKGIVTILGTLGNLDGMAAAKGNDLYSLWISEGSDIIATDRPNEVNRFINTNK
jgi:glycerophosphoryl diester phosphodiesterase